MKARQSKAKSQRPDVYWHLRFILSLLKSQCDAMKKERNKSVFWSFKCQWAWNLNIGAFQCERHNEICSIGEWKKIAKLHDCLLCMFDVCSTLVRYLFRYQWMHTLSCLILNTKKMYKNSAFYYFFLLKIISVTFQIVNFHFHFKALSN